MEASFEQIQRRNADPRNLVPALRLSTQLPEARVAAWLAQYQPDAIISGHLGLLQKLQSVDVSIPHECAYVSLHADEDVPGVSGISRLSQTVGAVAVNDLHPKPVANICGSRPYTLVSQVSGCWHEGWTLNQTICSHRSSPRVLCA
jgi:hypothetical protein